MITLKNKTFLSFSKKIYYTNIVSFSIVISLFFTKAIEATTLREGLEQAYNYSETVGIKRAQADFGKINRDTAFLALLPSVAVDHAQGLYKKHGFTNVSRTTLSVKTSLSFWKTLPGVYVAWKGKNAKEYEYNDFLESYGLLFIQKYMDILYNTKALEVYKRQSEAYEQKVKKVSILSKYGTTKRDKVVLAEAQLYENKANEITTKSTLDKTIMDYKIMTGQEPVDLVMPDISNSPLPASNKQAFVDLVLTNNSKLLQTKDELTAQKHYSIISGLNMLPDLYSEMNYTKYKIPGFWNMNMKSIGIGFTWTINGSDNRLNTFRREYKTYRIADLNYSLTLKQTKQDAEYAWDQYFAMKELVKATEKALKASTDSLKEVKVSVATGTATFIDEMDVESQYLNANLNYLNAQKAFILAYYKMISMTGVGRIPVL